MNLTVRVQPGARRDALRGRMADGTWKVAVTAPPEAGRANRAVVALLAHALGLRERQLDVVRGASSRTKAIAVEGLEPAEAERRLEAAWRDTEREERK